MTFLQLQQLVSYWVDDINFGYFTLAQVKRFLNQAQKEAQKQLLQAGESYYLKPVYTATVVNQQDYVVPDDFLIVNRLETYTGTPPNEDITILQYMTLMESARANNKPGTPYGYIIKKERLSLFPVPNSVINLRLYYSYLVVDMVADGDSPDLPERYHEYIALLAARDCFIKDGRDHSSLDMKLASYTQLMLDDSERRTQDGPRMVISTDDEYAGLY